MTHPQEQRVARVPGPGSPIDNGDKDEEPTVTLNRRHDTTMDLDEQLR